MQSRCARLSRTSVTASEHFCFLFWAVYAEALQQLPFAGCPAPPVENVVEGKMIDAETKSDFIHAKQRVQADG